MEKPQRQITGVAVFTLLGTSTPAQMPIELTDQLYVQQYKRLPVPLTSFINTNSTSMLNQSILIYYGDLPAYGLQRWQVEATLSDGSKLTATTPVVNLTP